VIGRVWPPLAKLGNPFAIDGKLDAHARTHSAFPSQAGAKAQKPIVVSCPLIPDS